MTINLYRFDETNQCVVETDPPLRRVAVVGKLFDKRAVRDGIKSCIANYGGPLAVEFKAIVSGTRLRLGLIVGANGERVNVRQFVDAAADSVVDALKAKAVSLSA